ncbi:MAG: J domain-containing protein [Treponema sp.]|jgi:DnaJ-domain-containing protein 1|nr:J domain-containing protein [Treponema sp.]
MGIFDRLGDVIKSYLNDDDAAIFGRQADTVKRSGDPDLDAAFEELDEFLGKKGKGFSRTEYSHTEYEKTRGGEHYSRTEYSRTDYSSAKRGAGTRKKSAAGKGEIPVPMELRQDFAELGLGAGASLEECKAAYKKLLKIHHPDRHAGHAGNMLKATEKSARINAAWDRIEKWYSGQ